MSKTYEFDKTLRKKDLIRLLSNENSFDMQVFENFNGNEFSKSDELVIMPGLYPIFELLIPNTTWTKKDYDKKYSDISLIAIAPDAKEKNQLTLKVDGIEHTFITTSDAIGQLFEDMKMGSYAKFLTEDNQHFKLLLHNFEYWFKDKMQDKKVLIRTVKEDGDYIARCFASTIYKPIDNHIVLYLAVWALIKFKVTFRLIKPKISHSNMKLEFLSEGKTKIDGVGNLSYGFTVINSESKASQVEFHPICTLTNTDGTTIDLIIDKPATIQHKGKNTDNIINGLKSLNNINDHLRRTIKMINLVKNEKISEALVYRIQLDIEQISKTAFNKFQKEYAEISSNNTLNLLQFFGRLNKMSIDDDEKELKIKYLFWKTLKREAEKKGKVE